MSEEQCSHLGDIEDDRDQKISIEKKRRSHGTVILEA